MGALDFTHEWNPQTALRLQSSYLDERSNFVSPWGESDARTQRFQARGQVDRALTPALGADGRRRPRTRAGRKLVHHRRPPPSRCPWSGASPATSPRSAWRAASRLFATAGLRVDDIVRGAIEGDPLGFSPRAALPERSGHVGEPACGDQLLPADVRRERRQLEPCSRRRGDRHPPAGRLRDRLHRQPGLKPERSQSFDAGFEQALAGGLVIVDATWFLNRYDDLIVAVGPLAAGLQPLPHRQHRERAGSGSRDLRSRSGRGGVSRRARATRSSTRRCSRSTTRQASRRRPSPSATRSSAGRGTRCTSISSDRHRRATAFVRAGGRSRGARRRAELGRVGRAVPGAGLRRRRRRGRDPRRPLRRRARQGRQSLRQADTRPSSGFPAPRRSFTVGSARCCGPIASRTSTTGRGPVAAPAARRRCRVLIVLRCRAFRTSPFESSEGRWWAFSVRTARARPRCSACSPGC